MDSDKKRILIVDDSADDIRVLMENLKQDYAILAATHGEKALAIAGKAPHPDAILLDVSMPEMDGYEVCRRLKSSPATHDIDIIFISAHDTTEEKLAGYDAGGSDYLIKPVQPSVLLKKVRLAIQNKTQRAAVKADNKLAMQTAMTAIHSAGEQGVLLDFMRRSFSVNTIHDLAALITETTASYGLDNSVQIRSSQAIINRSSSDTMSPLEQELLLRLKDSGRLMETDKRLIANFGPISQLIKNMPADQEKRGRLRDHLAILLEGAQARLRRLEQDAQLGTVLKNSHQILLDIEWLQKTQKENALQIMDGVLKNIEASFLTYGLTEEQESTLIGIVQTGVDKSLDNFEKGLKIDEELDMIINGMTHLLSSQK